MIERTSKVKGEGGYRPLTKEERQRQAKNQMIQ
jgi:hypothetical protein